MQEQILYFDNQHESTDILGSTRKLSDKIETCFDVKLTSRDGWVKFQGEDEAITQAEDFINCLRRARSNGAPLTNHGKFYALHACVEGEMDRVDRLFSNRIDVATGKRPIFARTFGQEEYINAIRKHDICFGVGPAGTGKTYLAMALAVSHLMEGNVNRIILTRPAVEAGESLGFLPGDMHQKVMPYLRPLYDALYDMTDGDSIQKHMEKGIIEVAPLAYMRGRTLNNAFIILDEAQNTTAEQMLMFLTRMGFDSKCVITGDPSQVDLPHNRTSGLAEALRNLDGTKGIAISKLDDTDVVRHELVQKIILAYRERRPTRKGA